MNSSFFACILQATRNIKATINHPVVAAVFIVVVAVCVVVYCGYFVVFLVFIFVAAVLLLSLLFLGTVHT